MPLAMKETKGRAEASIMAIGLGEHYLTMPLDQATQRTPLQVVLYTSLA